MILFVLFVVVIACILSLLLTIRSDYPEKRVVDTREDEDFVYGIRALARTARVVERGKGVRLPALSRPMRQAAALIRQKIGRDLVLNEGERWFHENVFLALRMLDGMDGRRFGSLPHSDGEIRILKFARYLVDHSKNKLNFDRVRLALETADREAHLTFEEICCFGDAVRYAAVEQVYILAERLLFYEKVRKKAQKGGLIKKYLTSDLYVSFLFRRDEFKEKLINLGFDPEDTAFHAGLSVVETGQNARYLFELLRNFQAEAGEERLLGVSRIEQLLATYGCYAGMDFATRKRYLQAISDLSEKLNVSETVVARKLMSYAAFNRLDPGEILFDHRRSFGRYVRSDDYIRLKRRGRSDKIRQWGYIASVALLTAGFAVAGGFLTRSVAVGVVSVLPLWFVAECFVNRTLAALIPKRPLPKMGFEKIPVEHATMIVVSKFISDEKGMDDAILHLKTLRSGCREPNVTAALLVDLKASDSPVHSSDAAILERAKKAENLENIFVFVRKRTKTGKRYAAYERKRGALNALARALVEGDWSDFSYRSAEVPIMPAYLIPIDEDNQFAPDGVRHLINLIAHPANAKYDLIAPESRYDRYSMGTAYGRFWYRQSSLLRYPDATSLFYDVFGRGIFCGKGIVRLRAFYAKLKGVFPDNKVLSHDIIEGAILNTASGGVIYEDAPRTFLSDRNRKKRWARGDLQLLPFVGRSWRKQNGERYRSQIAPIYKYLMLRNAARVVMPPVLFALGVMSFAIPYAAIVFAVAALGETLCDLLGILRRGILAKLRLRYMVKDGLQSVVSGITETALLPYYAFDQLILTASVVYKAATGGNMLEWKTYAAAQSEGGKFAAAFAPSLAVSVGIGMLLWGVGVPYLWYFVAISGCYIVAALWSASGSIKTNVPCYPSSELKEYAEAVYRYFTYMRNENGLIADNLQIKPYKGMSRTTSPTNIGFQMIAEICAYRLGFSTKDACVTVLKKILDEVDALEKWRGNLYNWYDVNDRSVKIPFVSSVDSGNFVAALAVVKGFALLEGLSELSGRADRLIRATDLGALFDSDRKLMRLGYDAKSGKFTGYYDLLASEARLTGLLYIAYGGDATHWNALSRDVTPAKGNTLLSWSGTAFEYLLPDLFLRPAAGSLLFCASAHAARMQCARKFRGLSGISESGYYAFDDELRYQYRAFGLDALALGRDKEVPVVSPYSSFLTIGYCPKASLRNLNAMKKRGLYADYGFYEAVDLSGRDRVVASYMTHHQGMTMLALTEAITEGAVERYLLALPEIRAVRLLLTEEQEQRVSYQKIGENRKIESKYDREYYEIIDKIEYSETAAGLTDGTLSLYGNARGNGWIGANGTTVNAFDPDDMRGAFRFYFDADDGTSGVPTFASCQSNPEAFTFAYRPEGLRYENKENGLSAEYVLEQSLGMVVVRLSDERERSGRWSVYAPLSLTSLEGYRAHPSYNGLFVHTEFLPEYNAVIAHKKLKKGENQTFWGFVTRKLSRVRYETNRFRAIGRGGSACKPPCTETREDPMYPSFGDVLDPCIALSGETEGGAVEIVTVWARSREELIDKLAKIPQDAFDFAVSADNSLKISHETCRLLGPMTEGRYQEEFLYEIERSGRREAFFAANGYRKLMVFRLEEGDTAGFKKFLQAVCQLRLFGCHPSVAVRCSSNALRKEAERLLRAYAVDGRIYLPEQGKDDLCDFAFVVTEQDGSMFLRSASANRFSVVRYAEESGSRPLQFDFKSGAGGFIGRDYYLSERPELPYSNVVCGRKGGFVATENGGGFIYFGNSRERRLTRFFGDPVLDPPCETIDVEIAGCRYRLNGGAVTAHARGETRYRKEIDGICFETVYRIEEEGMVKLTEIDCFNPDRIPLILRYSMAFERGSGFLYAVAEQPTEVRFCDLQKNFGAIWSVSAEGADVSLRADGGGLDAELILPCKTHIKIAFAVSEGCHAYRPQQNTSPAVRRSDDWVNLDAIAIETEFPALDRLFNDWLLYQTVSSRLNGKCGFYQVGGATGFRDQLQDVLCLLQVDPSRAREQILYAAARQYPEGDVMHWWHHPYFGLRTRISDDKLFLPYVTARYVSTTGDRSILEESVPFVVSPPLAQHEHDRYECAAVGAERATLAEHCLRAIKCSVRTGRHGLLLMGSGDWNDGMDACGTKGEGESVMTTMFAVVVMREFGKLCSDDVRQKLDVIAQKLKFSLETYAFDGNHYLRMYDDEGKPYGADACDALKIDSVAQSMAVFAGLSAERTAGAVDAAVQRLCNPDAGIVRLLDPPLTEKDYIGYISLYPQGVRENGGQYTHAAIWLIIALSRIGAKDLAFRWFQTLNPVEKCRDEDRNRRYGGEPYVLSGDVYGGRYPGRMGWSWYTGSASWAYVYILEELFGIRKSGEKLRIHPAFPSGFGNARLRYRYAGGELLIRFCPAACERVCYDGALWRKGRDIPLSPGSHEVVFEYAAM